jgi:hypothetical protein
VVTSLLAIVLGAVLTLGETSQRIAPRESERAQVIREAQVGLHRMTRELRHAYDADPDPAVVSLSVTPSTVVADVIAPSGPRADVSYDCNQPHPTNPDYTRCLRYVNGTGGEVIVDRVLNGDAVFTFTSPDYVRVEIEVAAAGDLKNGYAHPILLEDGFYMRNLNG